MITISFGRAHPPAQPKNPPPPPSASDELPRPPRPKGTTCDLVD